MRCERHFHNDVSEMFSEIPPFGPESSWLPPKGYTSLEKQIYKEGEFNEEK